MTDESTMIARDDVHLHHLVVSVEVERCEVMGQSLGRLEILKSVHSMVGDLTKMAKGEWDVMVIDGNISRENDAHTDPKNAKLNRFHLKRRKVGLVPKIIKNRRN
jgi:hypothetical protein